MADHENAGEKTGLSAAVDDLVDLDQVPPGTMPGEQAALFPLSKIDENQPHAKQVVPAKGVGRPPGAKNKNTEAWREFLLSRYPSPLQALAEVYSRKLATLAEELGYLVKAKDGTITRKPEPSELKELLQIQIAAADKLAPYVHSKMPQAVDVGENGLINLVINAGQQSQQNQQLNDIEFIDLDESDFDVSPVNQGQKGKENDGTTD